MKLIVNMTKDNITEPEAKKLYESIKNLLKDDKHLHINGMVMDKYSGSHEFGHPTEEHEI